MRNPAAERPKPLRVFYGCAPDPRWRPYGLRRHLPIIDASSTEAGAMADILYVLMGIGGFTLLGLLLRWLERI
jgi:hypothetical protein